MLVAVRKEDAAAAGAGVPRPGPCEVKGLDICKVGGSGLGCLLLASVGRRGSVLHACLDHSTARGRGMFCGKRGTCLQALFTVAGARQHQQQAPAAHPPHASTTLDSHPRHVHPQARPHLLALACGDPFLRLYDRRKLSLAGPGAARAGAGGLGGGTAPGAASRPVMMLAPAHLLSCEFGAGSAAWGVMT